MKLKKSLGYFILRGDKLEDLFQADIIQDIYIPWGD